MADKTFVSPDAVQGTHYPLPAKSYKDLCVVRDELRLFAALSARRSRYSTEMLVCRNTLGHCFEHLAQRMDDILNLLNQSVEDSATDMPRQLHNLLRH
jgi:hypothetical protein